MSTPLRARTFKWGPLRPQLSPVAAPFLFAYLGACSPPDFHYLTKGAADAGADSGPSQEPDADVSDAGVDAQAMDGGVDAQPEVLDGSAGIDAVGPDGSAPKDAGSDGEGGSGPPALLNPSFEQAYSGWTFVPPAAMGKYAYTQSPTTRSTTIPRPPQLPPYP